MSLPIFKILLSQNISNIIESNIYFFQIDKIARGQEAEKAKLNALVQKSEMKVRNLERTVAQKTKENEVKRLKYF